MQTIFNCMLSLLPSINKIRNKHDNVLIIVSVGNYYFSIGEDTKKVHEVLKLPVTNYRDQDLTYFDYKSLDECLPKLVRAGHRVAMYNPIDPK